MNATVSREAERHGSLVNVVDDPVHSNFILPAVVQQEELSIAISTGGGGPAFARRLRERFEELIGPKYGVLTGLLAELRPQLQPEQQAAPARA